MLQLLKPVFIYQVILCICVLNFLSPANALFFTAVTSSIKLQQNKKKNTHIQRKASINVSRLLCCCVLLYVVPGIFSNDLDILAHHTEK